MQNAASLILMAEEASALAGPKLAELLRELIRIIEVMQARIEIADAVAYYSARARIEGFGWMNKWSVSGGKRGGNWHVVTGLRNDGGEQDLVNVAIAYLDSRGLIERDKDGLVRVLDEMEAMS